MSESKPYLPEEYHTPVFPETIDFVIPGFKKSYPPGSSKSLALRKRDCEQWYNEFVDKVLNACGRQFLPVCRLSDGEYLFLLGEQPADIRFSFSEKVRHVLSWFKHKVLLRRGFNAFTQGHYHSGEYSTDEWDKARIEQPAKIRELANKGILALHLNYVKEPFAERYYPVLGEWLKHNEIHLDDHNYFPFYFIYALLTGPRRGELLRGRRILVVNGAEGEQKEKIIAGLKREGVSEVFWCPISLRRSLYDSVDMTPFLGKVDLALVGAGIGKAGILLQMETLNVPCIDAGFVFEVWKDPKNKWDRIMVAPDDCWESSDR